MVCSSTFHSLREKTVNLTRARAKRNFGRLVHRQYPDTSELAKALSVPVADLDAIKGGKGVFDSKLVSRIISRLALRHLAQRYCKSIFAPQKRHQGGRWEKGTVKGSGKIRRRSILKR
jgi:hypothetical protein